MHTRARSIKGQMALASNKTAPAGDDGKSAKIGRQPA